MGGIVKSIGKAIKGIGKAIKKVLPILLVAAAVYIGYGYMTGFQAGGWPKVINWGKSLMGGVQQGQTISQAATAATDMTAMAGGTAAGALDATAVTNAMATAPIGAATEAGAIAGGLDASAVTGAMDTGAGLGADAVTTGLSGTPLGEAEAVTGMPMGDTLAGGVPDMMGEAATQGVTDTSYWEGLIQSGQDKLTAIGEPIDSGWTDVTKGISNSLTETGFTPPAPVTVPAESSWWSDLNPFGKQVQAAPLSPVSQVSAEAPFVNRTALDQVMSDRFTSTGPGLSQAVTPGYGAPGNLYKNLITKAGETTAAALDETLAGKVASLGKKAWGIYKKMWADNPGMAMWTTNNVLRTILAMLDDTDEKESWRARHVGGFAPGGYDAVAKRYHGNLPGGRGLGRGYSQAAGRSKQIKTGPIPEAERGRSSAIESRSPGIIGSTQQGQV